MKQQCIELIGADKIYQAGKVTVPALLGINLSIDRGEMVAIMGPSGSGKSTLMNILGLLDRPSKGVLKIAGQEIDLSMSDTTLARLRGQKIGFVFQSFNLLPKLSALDNVLMPTQYQKMNRKQSELQAKQLLSQVGLSERLHHWPSELSGGEKQRVAIARALINDPDIILADEPTGNLDSKSGEEVIAILASLHKKGKTVIVITHDSAIAKTCEKTIHIFDGRLEGGQRAQ